MTEIREAYTVPVLDDAGLRLDAWDPESEADVAAWLRAHQDPEFRRWNTPLLPVTDLAEARDSLRARRADAAAGRSVTFRVTEAGAGERGVILGQIGVNAIDRTMGVARVGYWVLPEARGRRVAVRSLLLAARWSFTERGLNRMELGHAVGHEVSCRVAERGGFPAEGTLRGAMWEAERTDAYRDVHLHARLATDPEPAEAAG
ncbi:GNAT family N-acetyltransferase [Streptomyces sp. NPDC086091]|uniref:GNAT family N-acetyltransferase n=1 Tax=Streptomyces sp. NPDC086091 TaxID=3365751 RepID=UPI0037F87BF8